MSASRKKIVRDEGSNDILQLLPKELVGNILERLPIRDAVRTSVLSTNWRYLWSSRSKLVFDKQFFETYCSDKPNPPYAYMMIVYSMLLLLTGPVLEFSLYLPNVLWDWTEHIDKWLLTVSRNGIRVLQLVNLSASSYKLPSCVFWLPQLTELFVKNCLFKPPNKGFQFANLDLLRFESMAFAPDAYGDSVHVLPMLTTLRFYKCSGIENLKIFAPNLKTFVATLSSVVKAVSFEMFPILARVIISIGSGIYEQGTNSLFNFSNFLKKLPSAINLYFDGSWLRLSAANTPRRRLTFMLHHVTHLGLHAVDFDEPDAVSVVLCLLRSSPNLQTLDIGVLPSSAPPLESVLALLNVPDCIDEMLNLHNMKILSMIRFSKPLLLLVKCILARSPSLRSMHFMYVSDKSEEFNASSEFSPVSSQTRIIYSWRPIPSSRNLRPLFSKFFGKWWL